MMSLCFCTLSPQQWLYSKCRSDLLRLAGARLPVAPISPCERMGWETLPSGVILSFPHISYLWIVFVGQTEIAWDADWKINQVETGHCNSVALCGTPCLVAKMLQLRFYRHIVYWKVCGQCLFRRPIVEFVKKNRSLEPSVLTEASFMLMWSSLQRPVLAK